MSDLARLLQQLDAAQGMSKTAAADNAQPPSEGHPTDKIEGHLPVKEGETITTAADEQVAALGQLAAGGNPMTNDKEKKPMTVNTTVLDGSEPTPAELKPSEGLDDPGADTHPASPDNNDKYASMTDPRAIVADMEQVFGRVSGHLQAQIAAKKTAAAPAKPAPQAPAVEAPAGSEAKFASILREVIPATHHTQFSKLAYATASPYVQTGVEMAIKLANFMGAAEQDPAAAAAMLGGGDPAAAGGDPMAGGGMPPGMGGGDPMAGGGMPPDMGSGADAGGGGGGEIDQLLALIEQVSAKAGVPPVELLKALIGQEGDAGGGGAPPAAPGGGAPEAPAASSPSDDASDAGSHDDGDGADDEGSPSEKSGKEARHGKTAAAPRKQAKKAAVSAELLRNVRSLVEEVPN